VLHYIAVIIVQVPWLLLLAGAAWRMLRARYLYSRLQFYGAALVVVCGIARLVLLDPNFGVDPTAERTWVYGYLQVEPGAIAIGLLFFILGFFLDHRPGKGFQPWPALARQTGLGSFFVGSVLGLIAWWRAAPVETYPYWTLAWLIFTLGWYPFAVMYVVWSGRAPVRKEVRMPLNL